MTYQQQYDSDTRVLLEITIDFLVKYFGYSLGDAENLLKDFLSEFSSVYDEDFFHHESSYRLAAIVHYLQGLKGERRNLGHWLLEEGHNGPPREAIEYFNEHYFER